jgi:hypothetical protein
MKVSKLRNKVEIKAKTLSIDSEAVTVPEYNHACYLWADFEFVGGEIAQKKYGITEEGISARIKCHPNVNVVEENVVVFREKTYEIRFVAPKPDQYEALLRPVDIGG